MACDVGRISGHNITYNLVYRIIPFLGHGLIDQLKNISNLDAFFHVINQCDGAVELSLPEGGSVNLKSRLSQYFSMATVFSNGNIRELDITTHTLSDSERLINYMVQGS